MFYRLIFIAMVFLSSTLWANGLKDIRTFDAEFKQIIVNSSNKKIVYSGHIYIKEPAKILWQYKTPIIKNVYVLKDIAIVDEPELEQAIFTRLQNEIDMIKLIENAKEVSPNRYETTLYKITYTIVTHKNQIQSIAYEDELENNVTISFMDVIQNQDIDDKVFKFRVPAHYDIIRK